MGNPLSKVEDALQDKMARRGMLMREVEMSVNIAKARDGLMWFGGLYTALITGVTLGAIARKPIPHVVGLPIVLGGFGLCNLADMAYGTKLTRVVNEAEHIMEHERGRFVPPKQAPFSKFYTDEERQVYGGVGAVGTYWPGFLPMARAAAKAAQTPPKTN